MTVLQRADALAYGVADRTNYESLAPESGAISPAKRLLDVVGAVLAMTVFLPALIAIYLALLLSGVEPVFAQWRVCQDGRLFRCFKFRSMVRNADQVLADFLDANPAAKDEWRRSFKLSEDPRVTGFGAFLRRTSLDELPQLFNVLRGEMSLVGPRPIVPEEIERYGDKIHDYYRCRPGLTGLWQVSGRNLVSYPERVRLDAFYAGKQSLWLDIAILFRTVGVVLSGRGAC